MHTYTIRTRVHDYKIISYAPRRPPLYTYKRNYKVLYMQTELYFKRASDTVNMANGAYTRDRHIGKTSPERADDGVRMYYIYVYSAARQPRCMQPRTRWSYGEWPLQRIRVCVRAERGPSRTPRAAAQDVARYVTCYIPDLPLFFSSAPRTYASHHVHTVVIETTARTLTPSRPRRAARWPEVVGKRLFRHAMLYLYVFGDAGGKGVIQPSCRLSRLHGERTYTLDFMIKFKDDTDRRIPPRSESRADAIYIYIYPRGRCICRYLTP